MKSVAFIRSNDWFKNKNLCPCGTHNGYVAIPPTNKHYAMSFDELEENISVHGGVTFFETAVYGERTQNSWIVKPEFVGTKHEVLKDAEFLSDNTEIGNDWKIVGFDTMHFNDNSTIWNKEAVIQETLNLQRQLEEEEKRMNINLKN